MKPICQNPMADSIALGSFVVMFPHTWLRVINRSFTSRIVLLFRRALLMSGISIYNSREYAERDVQYIVDMIVHI